MLQWRGRLREEDPDAFGARLYLLFPISAAFLIVAVILPVAYLDPPWLPGVIVAGALLVSFVVGLFGVVLNLWRPQWLRPAWQRETMADDRRRAQRDAGHDGSGRYELEVVVGRSTRLLADAFDDLGSAERAAHATLAPLAGRGAPTSPSSTTAESAQVDAELRAAGLLGADGLPVALLEPVAAAAATVRVQLEVARVRGGRARRVLVQWSPGGLLVVPAGPADQVGDVAFQPPDALARTLWRLLHLGPRPRPPADGDRPPAGPLATTELLGAFANGSAPWLSALGAVGASLARVDIRTAAGPPLVSLALVDSPAGLWEITGDGDEGYRLRAIDPVTVFTVFAARQQTLMDRDP